MPRDYEPVTSRSELKMRDMLERIFPGKKSHSNYRPKWLNGCELDVYYPSENIAFEFNGAQHYRFVPRYHRTRSDFEAQQDRDFFKAEQCRARGIILITVERVHIGSMDALRERIAACAGENKREKKQQSEENSQRRQKPKRGRTILSRLCRGPARDLFTQ